MYILGCVDSHSAGRDVYMLDIRRTAAGLAAIASDQSLSLFDSTRLSHGPLQSLQTDHDNLTTLRHFEGPVVCTAGENGSVAVWDLRLARQVVQFQASQTPIISMACNSATQTIAVGTELQNHTASIALWDVRSSPSTKAHYQEVHSDDVTELEFHPADASLLLSGSTDGLVNIYDTRIADEDDVTLQTFNHNASIHHAGFLTPTEVLAISHDERFALYDMAEEIVNGDATQYIGDLREVLGCQYVANITPKLGDSGAIIGAGSQDRQVFGLVHLAKGPQGWALQREDTVTFPGAHGDELVRSFCVYDDEQVVFTAGEDGDIKGWRAGG